MFKRVYRAHLIIIKHTNPCGEASSKNITQAFKKSYMSDTKSAFEV